MQASTEHAGKRKGSDASKIRNVGPRTDTFLTIMEGDQSQRDTKRKLLCGGLVASQDDHKCAWDAQNTPKLPAATRLGARE